MALQGTISDFGLADIFQLIGIQRKTGVLTLDNGRECVTVNFLKGQVVGADTRSQSVEDLLGSVLVRTGQLTDSRLQQALRIQKNTLQRLGHILVKEGMVSSDHLIDALRVQSLQIVYRLFRWREGKYLFRTSDNLDYDEKHFVPISAETILMEGARMIDEWPIIERRIRSDEMVFRKTEAALQLEIECDLQAATHVDLDLDLDIDFDRLGETAEEEPQKEATNSLSSEEREVLALVDGVRSAVGINDRSSLGEFDTYRSLADLLTRQLIEEVKRPTAADAARRPRRWPEQLLRAMLYGLLVAFAASGLGTLRGNGFTPWHLFGRDEATSRLRFYGTQERLERLDQAIQVFYLDTGSFPGSLGTLTQGGYLKPRDLLDPWGRPYGYRSYAGGYQLFGLDATGRPSDDLLLTHRFTPVQRMMQEPPPTP